MAVDQADLEACYSQAWHGLYMTALSGEDIANPFAWLVLVTYRRAVDEHRSSLRRQARLAPAPAGGEMDDLLDDRRLLGQLLEGMRASLDAREREAAALCYLQGLSRSQAASRMGISDRRMRKLMEGRGDGRRGVSAKLGTLVAMIREGSYCEQQGSLMRALAYGVLDPDGQRYAQARRHCDDCPACRRYVVSLRGLAAALPPVLPAGHLSALLGALRVLRRPGGVRTGAVSSGAAGAGAGAGGSGWLAGAGPLGAKLAVGCLLAAGVGAGCVALTHTPPARRHVHVRRRATAAVRSCDCSGVGSSTVAAPVAPRHTQAGSSSVVDAVPATARASREFGPEQVIGPVRRSRPSRQGAGALARLATASAHQAAAQPSATPPAQSSAQRAAEREFSPG